MRPESLQAIVAELARRPGHEKVRAALQELLVDGLGADRALVEFEKRVPEARGRIDALLGRTAFEIKSDLGRERADAEQQLARYLPEREQETGQRYVGIATDGADWIVYEWRDGRLHRLREFRLDPKKAEILPVWLDGAVAIRTELPTDPATLRTELGPESVAFRRALADLGALWEQLAGQPSIRLRYELWQQLLRLVYGQDIENTELWLQHTYLVIVAKTIACRVLGLDVSDPADVLQGRRLLAAGVSGAIESDFFDWVLEHPGGRRLVVQLATHVSRFRLDDVETDVLKILYEALIDRTQRHGLGEYYTPDWLAAKMVREAVREPLRERVLDPACGSGTFLFHAVRHLLAAAAKAGVPEEQRAAEACRLVAGLDIHPVAVIIARVTFLLALGDALRRRRGRITVPVYVGDALQLSVDPMLSGRELVIRVPAAESGRVDGGTLRFPENVCRDPDLLEMVLERMHHSSESGHAPDAYRALVQRIGVEAADAALLADTYQRFDRLRREGRDSVWLYVGRNLARPLYLSAEERRADVVIGNPPWLAYRHMSQDLQRRFRELAEREQIYVGGKLATQNDLSALFLVRAAALYLRDGGRIAFVMPRAALTRGQFAPLRTGDYGSVRLRFVDAWDLDEVSPLFPVPACVLFAVRDTARSAPVPATVRRFRGVLPQRDAHEPEADRVLEVDRAAPAPDTADYAAGSPYRARFRQGATLVPRLLCLVERVEIGRLGSPRDAPLVRSRRTAQDKAPWKDLPPIEKPVEPAFLRPVLLGESILPFRVFRPFEGVVPVDGRGEVLDARAALHAGHVHLAEWLAEAEKVWEKYRRRGITLREQWDWFAKLSSQFPVAPMRVVYAKAGTLPAAALVEDVRAVVDHMLYWAPVETRDEGLYLAAVLGSEAVRRRIQGLQARGQWGARHFDKVLFTLPIPRFDTSLALHRELAEAGAEAEEVAHAVELPEKIHFQTARRRVREALAETGIAQRIDALVDRLLGGAADAPAGAVAHPRSRKRR